jgi:tetratricopeptide (TPR) repeat protein
MKSGSGRELILGMLLLQVVLPLHASNPISEALAQGQFARALQLTDTLLESHPGDVRLLTVRGVALKGLGRRDSIDSFEKALQLAPDFLPALEGAAEAAYFFHDSRLNGFVQRILVKDPENSTAHAMAGQLAFEAKDCASAADHFGKAGPLIARSELATRYGQCLIEIHQPDRALQLFESLVSKDPGNDLLRFNLGVCELEAQQFEASVKTFTALLTSPLAHAVVLDQLARAEEQLGRIQEAREHLLAAIGISPDREDSYLDLAVLLLENRFTPEALSVANRGLQRLPQSARLRVVRGVIFAEQSRYEDAEAQFEEADRLLPERGFGVAGQGVLYSRLEQKDSAAALLRERLHHSPDDYFLNYLLADVLLSSGSEPESAAGMEARQAIARSIRSNPFFPNSRILLGKLLVRKNEQSAAIQEFRAALQNDPTNRTALYQLAMALRKTGRGEDAQRVFQQFRDATRQLLRKQQAGEQIQPGSLQSVSGQLASK